MTATATILPTAALASSYLSDRATEEFQLVADHGPTGALCELEMRCLEVWELVKAAREELLETDLDGPCNVDRIAAMLRGALAILAATAEPMAAVRTALERAR